MDRFRDAVLGLRWLLPLYALLACGCANCHLPRIDPSGERLFLWGPTVPPAAAAVATPPVVVSGPMTTPGVTPPGGLTVSPNQEPGVRVTGPAQPIPGITPPTNPAAPQLEVAVEGPDSAAVGSEVRFTIRVTNRSSVPCAKLLITDRFDRGLQHAASANSIEHDLGDLPPGATKQIGVAFRVTQAGTQCQNVEISGDGNLRASARKCTTGLAPATSEPPPVVGAAPPPAGAALTVNKTGPSRRQVGEVAAFDIVIANNGNRALTNVRIEDNYESTLEPTEATEGWQVSGAALVWRIASVDPGKSVRRQVNCRCLRESTRACNRVSVTADGVAAVAGQTCLEIVAAQPAQQQTPTAEQAPSTAAGSLALSVADTVDPISVDEQETYSIVVTNNSDASDKQVQLTVTIPSETTLTNFGGPVRGTLSPGSIKFLPIAELRAGERVTFEVNVRAVKTGKVRLRAEVTSQRQRSVVSSEATTQIIER